MKNIRLRTPFEVTKTPLAEYPRPQFARDSYMTLNGEWDYAILKKNEKITAYQGKILVPFSPESLLSGLDEGVTVTPDDRLYYARRFTVAEGFIKQHTFINFDAVDYECEIVLNGVPVGGHKGGYTPFSVDVSGVIVTGENVIEVAVSDPSDTSFHARGKQKIKNGGIWYTPQSGIWQSVWVESVPESYLKDMTIVPDIDSDTVTLKLDIAGAESADIVIMDGGRVLAATKIHGSVAVIKMQNYELWSPENPKLYDLAVKVGGDVVRSYFGMRKFSLISDGKGYKRLALNNKPYFHSGVLDQGYWSDGMLTPPSNSALEYDVKLVKAMGFNMIRKHIKIEPMRWYYHCDKEGVLVWQDMVSGGSAYNFAVIGTLPFIGIHLKDDKHYKAFSRESEDSREEYLKDMRDTIARLKNVVSLAMWVPFNEGWGQFDSVKVTEMIRKLDPTRTIDSVSGWHDQGRDTSDFKSLHIYFKPIRMPKDKRCLLLSEFGGYSIKTEGHVYSDKVFGYRVYKDPAAFRDAFVKLYEKRIIPAIDKGLAAAVYTQVSDVECEINGLVTYDRKVVKLPISDVKAVNARLKYDN